MKTIIINQNNISYLKPYQGQDKEVNIGETLYVIKSKIPCVTAIKGQSKTFSIVTDKKPSKNSLKQLSNNDIFIPSETYYNCNRWSLNDKFIR